MDLWKYYRVFRRRFKMFLVVALSVLCVTTLFAALRKGSYVGVLRVFTAPPMGVLAQTALRKDDKSLMNTLIKLTTSQPVLGETIRKLNLHVTIQDLEKNVRVTQEQGTQIMRINVSDPSSKNAKAIADSIGKELKKLVEELNKKEATEAIAYLQQRIEEVQQAMLTAQSELNSFDVQSVSTEAKAPSRSLIPGVTSPSASSSEASKEVSGSTSNLGAKIREMNTDRQQFLLQIQQKEEELSSLRSKLSGTKSTIMTETGHVETPEFMALRSQLSDVKLEITTNKASGRTDDHPRVKELVKLQGELQGAIDRLKKSGKDTVSHSIESPNPLYQSLVSQSTALEANIRSLQGSVKLYDRMIAGAMGNLKDAPKRDVKRIQLSVDASAKIKEYLGTYDTLQRAKNLAQSTKELGTISVIGKEGALVYGGPLEAFLKAIIAGLAVSFGAGIAVVLGTEHIDNRVHTPQEVEEFLGLPILGIIPASANYPTSWRRRGRSIWLWEIQHALPGHDDEQVAGGTREGES